MNFKNSGVKMRLVFCAAVIFLSQSCRTTSPESFAESINGSYIRDFKDTKLSWELNSFSQHGLSKNCEITVQKSTIFRNAFAEYLDIDLTFKHKNIKIPDNDMIHVSNVEISPDHPSDKSTRYDISKSDNFSLKGFVKTSVTGDRDILVEMNFIKTKATRVFEFNSLVFTKLNNSDDENIPLWVCAPKK